MCFAIFSLVNLSNGDSDFPVTFIFPSTIAVSANPSLKTSSSICFFLSSSPAFISSAVRSGASGLNGKKGPILNLPNNGRSISF